MPTIPSARELTNAALGKKLSPKAQAAIDDICSGFPSDPPDACDTDNSELTNRPDNREAGPEPALLHLINEKLAEAMATEQSEPNPTPRTRSETNRANSTNSTGPKTPEGKAKVSANALKTGFFANVEKLNPQDSPAYLDAIDDLRSGLHPDGPVEDQLIRELAMFRARLMRLEAAEYALLCADIETNPGDAREIAASMLNNGDALDRLSKAETHLRRAYHRTWDRLERMQKERRKMPFNEAIKQSQIWATAEAIRTTCPKCTAADPTKAKDDWKKNVPPLHPDLDENGNPKKYPAGHPLYRPQDDEPDDNN